ncbi:aldolase-type TIM barrel family protein [Tasmannia lanceolata]|uniref:aldolase-type TIM barrel family protein n=1 Tax=Tasmannia lanceolata TaxID=3420 RepID=UPI004064583B
MGWRGILGFEYGIVQGPLGPDISGPELVSAVANAGAIGILRAPDGDTPDIVREMIRKTRTLTDKPFGVGVVLEFPHKESINVILEEKVALLLVSWGEYPKELTDEAHQAGVKVVHQVGSFEDAEKAMNSGVDAIILQGHEAGGHVLGQDGLMTLLPRVVDLVSGHDIPVIAAGGIVDSRGYVAALALGAQGICLGTRFVATEESYAHPTYKRKLVQLDETEYTNIFGRSRWPAPQRVLRTPFFNDWRLLPEHENEDNQPVIGHSIIYAMDKEIRRFAGTVPNATTTGDIESMAMYAGQGVGLIKEILPAGEVVKRLVEGAKLIIQKFHCDSGI